MVDRSDADLLAAAADGDGDSYGSFFRRHSRAVTAYAVRRCDNPDDVADLVADTFMIALQASGRYIPETPTALPWLYGIARRVLARQRRRKAGFARLLVKSTHSQLRFQGIEEDAIADAIDATRTAPALAEALDCLSRGEREVLELVAFEGLTPGEAAVVLELTPNAARLKLSRARRHMRGRLGAELGGTMADPEAGHAY
ncbi:MAG TPA: sigma-70 family RNA polymerase sigma factor [Acidimicrobiia bacterium]|nr:sigma-70 family RNA polymerase sigma factor [Acidimicrobiia bacterium]